MAVVRAEKLTPTLLWEVATRDVGKMICLYWMTSFLVTHGCNGCDCWWVALCIHLPSMCASALAMFMVLTAFALQSCACWVWRWQKKAGRCSNIIICFLGLRYHTGILGIQTELLTSFLASLYGQHELGLVNALNESHLLLLQPPHTQVISCSLWFVLPSIQEIQSFLCSHRAKSQMSAPSSDYPNM